MRKSTLIIMAILVVGFGALLIGADLAMEPLKEDIQLAKELRAIFRKREWVEPETAKGLRPPVRLSRVGSAADKSERLADQGAGILLVMRPVERLLADPGAMHDVAMLVAGEVEENRPQAAKGWNFDWIELRIEAPDGSDLGRTLIRREGDPSLGPFRAPEPALTTFLPWEGAAPVPKKRRRRAGRESRGG